MDDTVAHDIPASASRLLAGHPVFGALLSAAERQQLLECGRVRQLTAASVLCEQGQQDDRLFLLLLGEMEVYDHPSEESRRVHKDTEQRLGQGEVFGEIAALFNMPRISSVRASKPSVVLEIGAADFEQVINARAALRDAVWYRYRQRLIETALRRVEQFRHLSNEAMHQLQEAVSVAGYPAGSEIVAEGDPGDALYIIISGIAQVKRSANGGMVTLAELRPGEYFGEWSLLTGAPCAATVAALTPLDLLYIDRVLFLRFIQDHPSFRDRVDQLAHNRRSGSAVQKCADTELLQTGI